MYAFTYEIFRSHLEGYPPNGKNGYLWRASVRVECFPFVIYVLPLSPDFVTSMNYFYNENKNVNGEKKRDLKQNSTVTPPELISSTHSYHYLHALIFC